MATTLSQTSTPSRGIRSSPDPEVFERPQRRRFTAEYKLDILRQADACKPGELGALLRREGLYSSQLTDWRRQRDLGALQGLNVRRGRKPRSAAELKSQRLRRENERLQRELEKAQLIIDVQRGE